MLRKSKSPLEDHLDRIRSWAEDDGKTNVEIAALLGVDESSVRRFKATHDILTRPKALNLVEAENVDGINLEELRDALKKSKEGVNVGNLADVLDVSPRRVKAGLSALREAGYRVEWVGDTAMLPKAALPGDDRFVGRPEMFDGDLVRFGVVSDLHYCSKADNPQAVHDAWAKFQEEGISTVLNCGDIADGKGVFRGHIREAYVHTFDEQVDRIDDIHPRGEEYGGIEEFIIGGNHDLEGDFGREGADPVLALTHRREFMNYLGPYSAWIDLPNGATIHMLHPQGGASYANSYRPQKIAESYQPDQRPNITLIGHWHRRNNTAWLGIETFLVGTFQGATTFSVRKAMGPPACGFHIIEARMDDNGGLVEIVPRWFPFTPTRTIT